MISPDAVGMYQWDDGHKYHKQRMAAMKVHMDKHNKPGQPPWVIGPFCDDDDNKPKGMSVQEWAQVEALKKRPLTPEEQAKAATAQAETEKQGREAAEARIAELEKELAARKKASEKGAK
jgi:hypothetical protein